MKSVITVGADLLTSLGDLESTWSGLMSGQSGLVPHQLPGFDDQWPLGIIAGLPEATIGARERLDLIFARLFATLPELPARTNLICATTKGAVDELLANQNPAGGQPWHLSEELAKRLEISGAHQTVSAACASGTIAVIQGAMQIAGGECDNVLVVGLDLISRFVLSGFASLKALSPTGCRPFDAGRDGLSLGEGAGWVLLSSRDNDHWPAGPLTAQVRGWGISCDASHITAPCREASGLISCLRQTVEGSGLRVGGINAHGTGTIHNDAMELLAFSQLYDEGPARPVYSSKGALGHCLGAAGLIETALSLKSLQDNILPPTVGLISPAESRVVLTGKSPLPLLSPAILSCNSGFGGINAALLLAR
ncbi:MAG: beta-ketoacyl synthase N-terminal-like domain-containing protein [Thermodesulfobacteriota bacterium]